MTNVLKRYKVPKILLVEDNKADVLLIQKAIEKAGIKADIDHFKDGESVIDYVHRIGMYKNDAHDPDLILLDLNLVGSKLTGFDVLDTLKEHPDKRCIPVIILTSSSNSDDINSAYRKYANAYLVKPNDITELTDLMRTLDKFWLQISKLPV